MKALIINPPWEVHNGYGCRSNTRWPHIRKDKFLHFPIYLAYTASLLRARNIDVEVIDAVAEDLSDAAFVKKVCTRNADLCFIETSTPTINEDIRNALSIKTSSPAQVYLFGAHVTRFHEAIMKDHTSLDGIIRGEFEQTIVDIAQGKDPEKIRGLTLRTHNGVQVNPERELINDLNALPFPAWDLFDLKQYESHLYRSPSILMITSRGCPYQCSFCLWPDIMYGHRQRYRSPGNICDEMEILIEKFGVREIRFDDDTFALNKHHVIDTCNEIIRRGIHKKITWTCFGHITQSDDAMYTLLHEAGCFKIDFGVESGSEHILKDIGKSIDIEKAKKTVRTGQKHGLTVYCDFMIGFPGETREDIEKSITTAVLLDPDYIQVSYTIPYPGTRMYDDQLRKDNLLYPDSWEHYASCGPLIKNPSISEKEMIALYRSFWRRFYLRPRYILKTLLRMMRSPDEFKRNVRGFLSFARRFLLS